MAYFNELPNIEYLSRFADQSSNEDYILAKNIFRRAKLREDIAGSVTAFQFYQIKDNERPDQIADRIYGDSELDWVVLITNNITSYPSQWTLSNDSLYEHLIDKYGSEDAFDDIKHLETVEVKDEYDRLVVPEKLIVDPDIYQEFKTIEKEENDYPLFYSLNTFPINNKYYPLEIKINLGQYMEVWERDNQGLNEEYIGEEYQVSEIRIRKQEDPPPYLFPQYSKIDYSNLFVYGRDEIKRIFIPNSLNGWPSTWGGELPIYNRDNSILKIVAKSNIAEPVDIAEDTRLYAIVSADAIDTFSYTESTTISSASGATYNLTIFNEENGNIRAKFKVKRNNNGKIILVSLIDSGRDFKVNETIKILGSQIGGIDITDDITITVNTIISKPEFRFISIG
jgi:hypothetical protein